MSAGGGDLGCSNGHWPLNLLDQPTRVVGNFAEEGKPSFRERVRTRVGRSHELSVSLYLLDHAFLGRGQLRRRGITY